MTKVHSSNKLLTSESFNSLFIARVSIQQFFGGSLRLDGAEVWAPALSSCVLLEAFLLGPPVLEPHLHHAHVQPGLGAQLFSHMSRGLGTLVIGAFEGLQLFGCDGGAGAFVGIVYVKLCKVKNSKW